VASALTVRLLATATVAVATSGDTLVILLHKGNKMNNLTVTPMTLAWAKLSQLEEAIRDARDARHAYWDSIHSKDKE